MFSKTTEYALRATIYIAQKSTIKNKLGIVEISEAIDSPQSFTAKILQMLTKDNKVISSAKGPNGGFYITGQSKKLPARAILEAVNDDEVLQRCVLGLRHCSEKTPCPMHEDFRQIRTRLTKLFEKQTIGNLAQKMNKHNFFINNTK
ncbi:MAG TPA: Rrf2 family transcriptional regulator [Hanamia sp.]|nr:Rrf2 family transcriptional regulator [Hanamia sp.]